MLQRWDPFGELRRMDETMGRLWRGLGNVEPHWNGDETLAWRLPLDVIDEGDRVLVKASLPGFGPEDIEVSLEDHMLTIKGLTKAQEEKKEASYLIRERRVGSFHRAIRLPDTVDADKAESTYEHGELVVTLPKVEAKKAKQLKVKVSGEKMIEGKKS